MVVCLHECGNSLDRPGLTKSDFYAEDVILHWINNLETDAKKILFALDHPSLVSRQFFINFAASTVPVV